MLTAAARTAVALFGLLALGCGPEFDRPSELQGLRVLAVQKDLPYAKPGDDVTLKMLWYDEQSRDVQRLWIPGCVNPAGDLFLGCFQQFAEMGGQLPVGGGAQPQDPCTLPQMGDTLSYALPADIVSSRPPPADPTQPAYGVAYVFFAACAGNLCIAPQSSEPTFPFVCRAPPDDPAKPKNSGRLLGTNDFVFGYTAVYAYNGRYTNQNPVIDGFRVRGLDLLATSDPTTSKACVGGACLCQSTQPGDCTKEPTTDELFGDVTCGAVPCVDPCPDDGKESCPGTPIQPIVNPSSEELDQISSATRGRNYFEEQWIDYYVSRGKVKSDARLVSDAIQGSVSDYGTLFRAPKDSGPVDVFAVVHDNRGGVQWVRSVIAVR